jgi:Mg/Co/Ni transporter MgtE
MNAQKKKAKDRLEVLRKQREEEHNRILKRFEEKKKELESKQTYEKNLMERQYNNRFNTAGRSTISTTQSKMRSNNKEPATLKSVPGLNSKFMAIGFSQGHDATFMNELFKVRSTIGNELKDSRYM